MASDILIINKIAFFSHLTLDPFFKKHLSTKSKPNGREILEEVDRVFKRSGVEHLGIFRRELVTLMLQEGGSVQQHLVEMRKKWNEYTSAGGKMDEADYIMLILQSLPPEFRTVVSTLSRLQDLTVYEVEKALEQEELILRGYDKTKNVEKDISLMARSRGGHQVQTRHTQETRRCFKCDKVGHLKIDCPRSKKHGKREQGNAAISKPQSMEHFFISTSACFGEDEWILDSGASSHICNNKEFFKRIADISPIDIGLAGTSADGDQISIQAKHKGIVELAILNNGKGVERKLVLTDVLFSEKAAANIISVRKITAAGGSVVFKKNRFHIIAADRTVIAKGF